MIHCGNGKYIAYLEKTYIRCISLRLTRRLKLHAIYFEQGAIERMMTSIYIFFVMFLTDEDECSASATNKCDPNAKCTNVVGSYICHCKEGYRGNGYTCTSTSKSRLMNTYIHSLSINRMCKIIDLEVPSYNSKGTACL